MNSNHVASIIALLVFLNFWIWSLVFNPGLDEPAVYFLDVGQGDAQLVVLPREERGDVKILIDAGRASRAVFELDKVLGRRNNKYIDLLILSHAHLDHFGGFSEILARYRVGAFIYNGRGSDLPEFKNLLALLEKNKVPILTFKEGSKIIYSGNSFLAVSPGRNLLEMENLDEGGLVLTLNTEKSKALFTGDIGFPAEEVILDKGYDIDVDILKVGHHGSPNSTSVNFAHTASPLVSVIGVGDNRHGHPAQRVIDTLESAGSLVYTTRDNGTIKLLLD